MRLGVRVPGAEVPRWIANAVGPTVAVLLFADDVTRRPRTLAARVVDAYLRVDRLFLGPLNDAEAPASLPAGVTACGGDKDVADVDVWLDFADPELAVCGEVWRLRFGATRGARPTFRDLVSDTGVCRVALEVRAAGAKPVLVGETFAGTDDASVSRARSRVLWRASVLVRRALRERARLGRIPPARGESAATSVPRPPSLGAVARHAAAVAARVAPRRAKRVFGRQEWCVGIRPAVELDRSEDLTGALRDGPPLTPIAQPHDVYRADPFLADDRGRSYLFVEEFAFGTGRGHISVAEVAPTGLRSAFRDCLKRPYHLSYPFVFESEGVHYMLPESFESRRIELYRAVDFPWEWRLDAVLVDDIHAVDSTLLFDDGLWWLFTSIIEPPASGDEELSLFFAPALHGPWATHPSNPVVADARFARCAGRLFRHRGRLVRPAQDGSRHYGSGINLRYVTTLNEDAYAETAAGYLDGRWLPGAHATHSYDRTPAIEAADGERWRFGRP